MSVVVRCDVDGCHREEELDAFAIDRGACSFEAVHGGNTLAPLPEGWSRVTTQLPPATEPPYQMNADTVRAMVSQGIDRVMGISAEEAIKIAEAQDEAVRRQISTQASRPPRFVTRVVCDDHDLPFASAKDATGGGRG